MYQLNEMEYKEMEKIVYHEMKSFVRIYKYDRDEFYSMGIYALGKACATWDKDKTASFKTYAATCIRNEYLNFNRKCQNNKKLQQLSLNYETNADSEDEATTMLDKLVSDLTDYTRVENHMDLEDAYKVLSPRDFKMITMWRDGYKHKEIAEELGINTPCVGRYLIRIYSKLRKELEVGHV